MPETEGALCVYTALNEPAPESSPPALVKQRKPVERTRSREAPLKPAAVMAGIIQGPARGPPRPFKPALLSILDACQYLGGVSRAKFYADILPKLETVKLGRRNFVVVASMDRLIEASRQPAG
jgi:hypothetical protein